MSCFPPGAMLVFTLDDKHEVVEETDLVKWAHFWDQHRFLADENVNGIRVATIFLGLALVEGWDPAGRPHFFESMVFDGPDHTQQYRDDDVAEHYHTWDEAMTGHRALVEQVKKRSQ